MSNTSKHTPTGNNQHVWTLRLGAAGAVLGAVSALSVGGSLADGILGAVIWAIIAGLIGTVIDKRANR
ncbi:MAG: hypothetical protein JJU45_16440 [Acidimicrobiia bacterium]|nr:hypothetical protein [Acidimicrobiia bacterium]